MLICALISIFLAFLVVAEVAHNRVARRLIGKLAHLAHLIPVEYAVRAAPVHFSTSAISMRKKNTSYRIFMQANSGIFSFKKPLKFQLAKFSIPRYTNSNKYVIIEPQ